jgi:hypothetical protein
MEPRERAVRDFVREVVASHASHELPYLARLERFDDSWVLWRLRRGRGRDEPLGFGVTEVATLVTPVIWITLNEAAKEFGAETGGEMFAGARALLRRIARRKPRPMTLPPLTEEQRKKVRAAVRDVLKKKKLSDNRADEIADAVFWALSKDCRD